MVDYEVTVYTANRTAATTFNNVFIKLVGTSGESERKWLFNLKGASAFVRGAVASFTVSSPTSLGKLVLVELDKQPLLLFPEDSWFPAKVEVKSPDGDIYNFPVYRWISDSKVHRFREGTALKGFEDSHQLGRYSREEELKQRQKDYCTKVASFTVSSPTFLGKLVLVELDKQPLLLFPEDSWFPAKVEVKSPDGDIYNFPVYRWISDSKVHRFREGTALKGFEDSHQLGRYSREEELKQRQKDYCWDVYVEGIPHCIKTDGPSSLPPEVRFSFTKQTEFIFTTSTGLAELKLKGLVDNKTNWTNIDDIDRVFCCNIFLCDYKRMDGVKANTINDEKQYLMAPLVLLHKTPDDKLMPIAIQLKQKPAEDNPIFLPSDSEYDWLMAKIFVRSADFSEHQLNVHLLRTHLLAEVFAVSLLRNVPMVHPLHKLLIPHTRYTLQINFLARNALISEEGVFTKFSASGGEGMITILRRSLSSVTYSSLCVPEDIAERGVKDVPNFYYRDDALRLWDTINRFVRGILTYYYKTDAEVQQDSELQKWILDIFEHGFLSQPRSGIPQKLTTVDELIKFVTMVIFTGSAQHAAVNSGQFDFGSWMPNTPISLQLPPPTKKGEATEETMLKTLPDVNTTVQGMATLWLLSQQSSDFAPLGQYSEDHFSEETPRQMIANFQKELAALSAAIKERNKTLEVPYTFLDPEEVENSVAI
ncbi:PREDICTED: arachidonate 15-lipoxygenase B-like [Poecilia mexicana]|uniref:arachidonate 15-lipoxygenase B-like n=1 Tax=Poecilia mexicana TaxID=48701 RepID=UPI00072DA38B|nr:PREDICTED: arachidonate 15-lipoxygenase B-like [Poecilia mexicana]